MVALPTFFISHGSPMLALQNSPARQFLQQLGHALPRPTAIVVASAHWELAGTTAVSFATQPVTIHDFGGFSAALYAIDYPAPGAPELAAQIVTLLEAAQLPVKRHEDRGLDHGAWVPLRLMFPDADIPVVQVALMHGAGPSEHERLGAALAPLREQGVLIIGSGSLTHNLQEFRRQNIDAPVPSWVSDFGTWMHTTLQDAAFDALCDYRQQAPFAERNHPTEEHLLPLFVALGAAGVGASAQRVHASHQHGVLAMDVFSFSSAALPP